MTMKLLDVDGFRAAAKDGQTPDCTVFRYATTEPETVGEAASRTKRFVFSDATVDHSDDSIDPKGWNLGVFKKNPVALFCHSSWDPPIGRASNVSVQGNQLVGDIEFASADVYAFADTIYRLVDGGYLKAVSVGFKPDDWAWSQDKDRPYGIDFKKQTLLEISVCAVPCNPNALGEARSKGIDTAPLQEWAEKVLDTGDVIFMPRTELEALRTQAKGVEPVRFYIATENPLPAKAADKITEAVKRWQDDPKEVLILPPGVELRAVGASNDEAPVFAAVTDAPEEPLDDMGAEIEGKAGRRVSAATKAKLQEAMGHHEAMGKCIKDLIDTDEPEEPGDDPDEADEVPEAVILETVDDLTPEQRRLKDVAALRADLPLN